MKTYEATATAAAKRRQRGPANVDMISMDGYFGFPNGLTTDSDGLTTDFQNGLTMDSRNGYFLADVYTVDLAQAFAGMARPTALAAEYGLQASDPADTLYGWDLASTEGAKRWQDVIKQKRPLVVIISMCCTLWSRLNVNLNYSGHRDLLERLREPERHLLGLMVETMREQHHAGRYFLFENPAGSDIFLEKVMEEVYDLPPIPETDSEIGSVIGHGCMYGANYKGKLTRKGFRWVANHRRLLQAVGRRCDGSHEHAILEGKRMTEPSGIYTEALSRAILEAIVDIAAEREPARFAQITDVNYTDAEKDIERWQPVVDLSRAVLSRTKHKAPITVSTDDNLYKLVAELVPWQLRRVQLVPRPRARRMPTEITWKHRGALIVPFTGAPTLETEALRDLAYPCLRFSSELEFAVMFWGEAPDEEPKGEPKDEYDTPIRDENQDQVEVAPKTSESQAPLAPEVLYPDFDVPDDPDTPTRVPRATTHGDITFTGLTKEQAPLEIRRMVARMHLNYGHPRKRDLLRFAASQGANANTLTVISALRCKVCERAVGTSQPRPARLPRVGQFADSVQMDIFFVMDLTGTTHTLLGLIDVATLMHQVGRLTERDPDVVWDLVRSLWLNPFGLPQEIVADLDGAFRGNFEDNLTVLGVPIRYAAPGSHWQIGKAESHNNIFRAMLEKVIDHLAIYDTNQLDVAITAVAHAKNSNVKQAGRTAFQAAFGRVPALPGELLSDTSSAQTWDNMTQHQALAFAEESRVAALRALADVEGDKQIRLGILRKPVMRKEFDPQPGQPVCIWRERGRRRAGKTAIEGFRPAVFAMWDPGTDGRAPGENAWVRSGGATLMVSREQLRPAVGYENWAPDTRAWKQLRRAQRDLDQYAEEDAVERGPTDDGENRIIDQLLAYPLPPVPEDEADEPPAAAVPLPPATEEEPAQPLLGPTGRPNPTLRAPHRSSAAGSESAPDSSSMASSLARALEPTAARSRRSVSPSPKVSPAPSAAGQSPDDLFVFGDRESDPDASSKRAKVEPAVTTSAATAMVAEFLTDDAFTFALPDGYDGGEDLPPIFANRTIFEYENDVNVISAFEDDFLREHWDEMSETDQSELADVLFVPGEMSDIDDEYNEFNGEPMDGSGASRRDWQEHEWFYYDDDFPYRTFEYGWDDDDANETLIIDDSELLGENGYTDVNENTDDQGSDGGPEPTENAVDLSRKERKAMDREIPWRAILQRSKDDIQKFIDAIIKEVANWEKYNPVEPIDDDEAERIMADPELRRRCIPSRVCYRDKNCGVGDLHAKARPVLLGFRDPDLRTMKRNASVMRRVTMFCILQIAASHFHDPDGPWSVGCGDAMSAFLQGDQEDRPHELFMLPPRDPLVEAAGAFPHKLYRVKGNVYGGANGPYLWKSHVRKVMIGKLKFRSLRTDEMVFTYYNDGNLLCIIGFHVDDALMACSPHFDKDIIMKAFEWSPWRWLHDGQVDMVGLEVNQIHRGDEAGTIVLTQSAYVKETPVKRLPNKTPGQSDELDQTGLTEFSSCNGCLQWVTGKTRADLSAANSLLQSGSPTRSDLRNMYYLIEYAHKTADVGIKIVPTPLDTAVFVAFHDSSWANAEGLRTQVGYVVLFTDRKVLKVPCLGSILEHRSVRTPRVVRSSLAGEACAATTATDAMYFANAVMSEITHAIHPSKDPLAYTMYAVTDCKCLYDSIQQATPSLTEKRTILDIIAIQEVVPPSQFRWVPTGNMIADGLTKFDWKLIHKMTEFMSWPEFCLVKVDPPAKQDLKSLET